MWMGPPRMLFFSFYYTLLLGYICYRGRNSWWQSWLDLYCTLVRSPPPSLPLNPVSIPLKAIARGFFVLFHISICSPSTIYPYLNLLHSSSLFPLVPPNTVPILQSCLSLLTFKSVFKGVSQNIPIVSILFFHTFNPFHYSPLLLYFQPSFFNSFQYTSLYPLPSQMFYNITDAPSFSFLFSLSLSSIE
jgi:hypothetical protein